MRGGVLLLTVATAVAHLGETAWAQTGPTVTSNAPAWRAPGAPPSVRGTAGPGATVELWLGASRRGTVVRAPSARGRCAVAVASSGERTQAGALRVRPVRLAAGADVFDWSSPGTNRTGILRLGLGRNGVVSSRFLKARINWVQPRLR